MNVPISSFIICVLLLISKLAHSTRIFPQIVYDILNYELPNIQYKIKEDALLSTPRLIAKNEYPVEIHDQVRTEDGYILTMHRIPYGRKFSQSKKRPVVLIMHGFISNSGEIVIGGPGNSLGYYLADVGFDVWLGNTRGSRYSTKHVSHRRSKRKYWDFTWADIGYYDIPAMIDYILQTTGHQSIFYIGHSRGAMSFYVMCSERPEYNKKIRAMASLAPVSYMRHQPNPVFHYIASHVDRLQDAMDIFGIYHYTPNNRKLVQLCEAFMHLNVSRINYCSLAVQSLAGFDYDNYNTSILPVFIGHFPDSCCIKELTHFGQIILSGKFCHYDYGKTKNLAIYNSLEPPSFDLAKISAPVAIFYSTNDLLSSAKDIDKLYNELGNPIGKFQTDGFSHFTYFNGYNMTSKLYDQIIEIFSHY